jgi:hypothetical protein
VKTRSTLTIDRPSHSGAPVQPIIVPRNWHHGDADIYKAGVATKGVGNHLLFQRSLPAH